MRLQIGLCHIHCFAYLCVGVVLCENQGNCQNFDPSLLPNNFDWFSWGWSKKIKMAGSKNLSFSTTPKNWAIVAKISKIGPWVSRVDWCEGHQCESTYMTVRLSDISSKKGWNHKKGSFSPFLSLRRTTWRPYRLSHIDALRINQSY